VVSEGVISVVQPVEQVRVAPPRSGDTRSGDTRPGDNPGGERKVGERRAGLRSEQRRAGEKTEVTRFPRTPWGHRGYDETVVDEFADRAGRDLAAAEHEIVGLRAEVERLHTYIRRQWAAVAAAETADGHQGGAPARAGDLVSPAVQARAVLDQAQEIVDRRLADADLQIAERISRADVLAAQVLTEARSEAEGRRARAVDDADRLLLLARSRYEEIVIRAHHRADQAAEMALDEFEHQDDRQSGDGGRARAELEVKAAYLRTFAKVSRAALQAALDVTAREFDRLLGASASDELTDAGTAGTPMALRATRRP
jgi:cell division septum initiation protein DivIVA